jgi:aspartyl-tRNA synthetase
VKNLAFIKCEGGEYKSPLWKFFTDAEKDAARFRSSDLAEGDIVFFAAGRAKASATILGRVRSSART